MDNWFRNCRQCRCNLTHKELRALKGFATGAWFEALAAIEGDSEKMAGMNADLLNVLLEFDEAVAMVERGKI
jgi:hypothetical protein